MSPLSHLVRELAHSRTPLASTAALALAAASHATNVGGFILADTTWTTANSSYIVTSQITIGSDAKLTIQPGVVVKFNAGTGIQVGSGTFGAGTLKAIGTPSQKILFTSNSANPQPGQWKAIDFTTQSVDASFGENFAYLSGSVLEDVVVEFSGNSGGAVLVANSAPYLHRCEIRESASSGVNLLSDSSTAPAPALRMRESVLHHNSSGLSLSVPAWTFGKANLQLSKCSIHSNSPGNGMTIGSGYGGDVTLDVSESEILNNAQSGLSISGSQSGTNLLLAETTIADNGGAGAVASIGFNGGATLSFLNNSILRNAGGGLNLSSSSGSVELVGNLVADNTTGGNGGAASIVSLQPGLVVTVNDNSIIGNHARRGGGLYLANSGGATTAAFERNTIVGNVAEAVTTEIACGGGVLIENGGSSALVVELHANSITGNLASGGSAGGVGFGGGLYVTESTAASATQVLLSGDPINGTYNVFSANSADLGSAVFNAMLFAADGSNDIKAEHVCWGGLDPGPDANQNLIYDFFDTKQKALVDYEPFIADPTCVSGEPVVSVEFGEIVPLSGEEPYFQYGEKNEEATSACKYHAGLDLEGPFWDSAPYGSENYDTTVKVAYDGIVHKVFGLTAGGCVSATGNLRRWSPATGAFSWGAQPTIDREGMPYAANNHHLGQCVIVWHPALRLFTLYSHLDAVATDIAPGVQIPKGHAIGKLGNSGGSVLRACESGFSPIPNDEAAPGCSWAELVTGSNAGFPPHVHFELKHFGTLGNLTDDSACFGYVELIAGESTPNPNLFGFLNPRPYFPGEGAIEHIAPIAVEVTTASVVREGPGASFATIVATVLASQRFVAFARQSDWYQVYLPSVKGPATGWIQGSPIPGAQIAEVTLSAASEDKVNVRSTPAVVPTNKISAIWRRQMLARTGESRAGNGCAEAWWSIAVASNAVGGAGTGWACSEFLDTEGSGVVGDLDGDGSVGAPDLAIVLGSWGASGSVADLDGDGTVGAADVAILLGAWTV